MSVSTEKKQDCIAKRQSNMEAKGKNVQLKIILRKIGTFSLCLLFYVCFVRAYHTVTKLLGFLLFLISIRVAISEQGLPA